MQTADRGPRAALRLLARGSGGRLEKFVGGDYLACLVVDALRGRVEGYGVRLSCCKEVSALLTVPLPLALCSTGDSQLPGHRFRECRTPKPLTLVVPGRESVVGQPTKMSTNGAGGLSKHRSQVTCADGLFA